MAQRNEEAEVVEEKTPFRPKISLVVILSIVLGLLLGMVVVEGVVFSQRNKALEKELITLKKELKEKSTSQGYLEQQIESLSKQLTLLKEYSVARSNEARVKKEKPEAAAPVNGAKPASTVPVGKANPAAAESPAIVAAPVSPTPPQPVIPPKLKRPQPEGLGCELIGKSPEEQAAVLKRCVGVMDMTKEKAGSKK